MIATSQERAAAPIWNVHRLPKIFRNRGGLLAGLTMFVVIILSCFIIPVVSPYPENALVAAPYEAPSSAHLLGTDSVGRDLFTRVFAGGRIDLLAAAAVVGISLVFGTLVGTFSGSTKRRWLDIPLMRVVDALIAFPFIILILVMVVFIGQTRAIGPLPAGLPATLIGFCLVMWAYYARLARGQTLALRERDYIVAATILGYSRWRIVSRHLAPSVFRVTASYAVADAILAVVVIASLSFLGAGVGPPTPEWGSIMYEGRAFLGTAWWITVAPGVMLALTGVALSLVADNLLTARRMTM